MVLLRNKCANRLLIGVLGLAAFSVVVVYVVVPLVFLWFPAIMRSFIFVPDEEIPQFLDYGHPEKAGFVGGQNFYLESTRGAKVGVWHTLPKTLKNKTDTNEDDSAYRELPQNATVFLYLHGSAGTRTSSHRLRTYKLLNSIGYHVLALDYRGYGDSVGFAENETDLVADAKAVYMWIRERVTSGKIFLWGHSLGTGVAAHLVDLLVGMGQPVAGVVMESPFDNMADAVRAHHLAKIVSPAPWYEHCLIEPLKDNDMAFTSDKHLANVTTPVIILAAKDDAVIPYDQAVKLYKYVTSLRTNPASVELKSYDASLGYGHYHILRDPNIDSTIKTFVDKQLQ